MASTLTRRLEKVSPLLQVSLSKTKTLGWGRGGGGGGGGRGGKWSRSVVRDGRGTISRNQLRQGLARKARRLLFILQPEGLWAGGVMRSVLHFKTLLAGVRGADWREAKGPRQG